MSWYLHARVNAVTRRGLTPALIITVALSAALGGGVATAAPVTPATPTEAPGALPTQRTGTAAGQNEDVGGDTNNAVSQSQREKYPAVKLPPAVKPTNTARSAATAQAQTQGFQPGKSREVVNKRTTNTSTFRNADGSQTTKISLKPVNYKTVNGTWAIATPTYAKTTRSGRTVITAANGGAPSELATTADADALATVTIDDTRTVTWTLDNAAPSTAEISGDTTTYRNVLPSTDLEMQTQSDGVKETLVLASAAAPRTFDFPLALDGLVARHVGNQILFHDDTGRIRARIPAGFMIDSASGPNGAAQSNGVQYELTGEGNNQRLTARLDSAWLNAPERVYPVRVDPSVLTTASDLVIPWTDNNGQGDAFDWSFSVGKTPAGGKAAAEILMPTSSVEKLFGHKIFGVQLGLVNYNAASCSPRPVDVRSVISATPNASAPYFPLSNLQVGPVLNSASFAYGYIPVGATKSACAIQPSLIDLGTAGRDLVQSWADLKSTEWSVALTANTDDPLAFKQFTSERTANPPTFYVTHSAFQASYDIPNVAPSPVVLKNRDGKVNVTVTNRGAEDWTPQTYHLAYRIFNSDGKLVGIQRAATLPSNVSRYSGQATMSATIKAMPVGRYTLDFTMVKSDDGTVFTDEMVPPARMVLDVYDIPPVITSIHPQNGYQTPTLTPQLYAKALDQDDPDLAGLTYEYAITPRDGATPFSSGQVASPAWVIPAGKLTWNKAYDWSVTIRDRGAIVTTLGPVTLLTDVPQPEITGHLSGAKSGDGRDFDPLVGNYTTAAIDAPIVTAGPSLSVARTYNSLDPRTAGLFGAGWSTRYDMRVSPEPDGSGNVRVTLDTGREVRFGKNPDGSYVAPPGQPLTLTANSTEWTLRDASGSAYTFYRSGLVAGKLSQVSAATGKPLRLDYDSTTGKLTAATNLNSNRSLTFVWSGSHVSAVKTPAIGSTTSIWRYTYSGDLLTQVCAPGTVCTKYEYGAGSHYRSAVLDARPDAYWRLGEGRGGKPQTGPRDARSEIAVNLGADAVKYDGAWEFYDPDQTRQPMEGYPGALAGTANTAFQLAWYDDKPDSIALAPGQVKRSVDGAVEMWFKTKYGGQILLGYETATRDPSYNSYPVDSAPILSIGIDGKLRGQFRTGTIAPITSTARVDNDTWHHAVLSSLGSSQSLYLDGQLVNSTTGIIDHSDFTKNAVGYMPLVHPTNYPWLCLPDQPCEYNVTRGYVGQLDEPAIYAHPLASDVVTQHYQLAKKASQQLTKVVLPSGKTAAQISYDTDADRVAEYTDGYGGSWKVGKPSVAGNASDLRRTVTVRDPADRLYLYEYDALTGQMLRTGSPTGVTTRTEDRTCAQPSEDDPAFCLSTGEYGLTSDSTVVDADGLSIRTFAYDDAGHLRRVYNEVGNYIEMVYDARGNVTARTTCRNPNPKPQCSTSRSTFPTSVSGPLDPLGDKPLETRDGRSSSATDNRYRTSYAYNATGSLLTQTAPDGGVTSTTYSAGTETGVDGGTIPSGLPLTSTDALNRQTKFAYFASGDMAQTIEPSGLTTTYTYDAWGRKLTETETSDTYPAPGLTVTYTYDALSRVLTTTAPKFTNAVTSVDHTLRTLLTYDADGNVTGSEVRDVLAADPARVTKYDYDDHNLQIRVTDSGGNETNYGYDRYGNQTSKVEPTGTRWEYAYSARNMPTESRIVDPDGRGDADPEHPGQDGYLVVASTGYDQAGRPARMTDAMGRTTVIEYFKDDLVKRKVLKTFHKTDGTTTDFVLEDNTYDGAGNLVKQVTDNGATTTTMQVDAVGRVSTQTQDPNGVAATLSYTYDLTGNVKTATRSGRSSNIPGAVTTASGITTYGYDTAGRRNSTSIDLGNGTASTTTTTFDQRGLPASSVGPLGNVSGATAAVKTANTTSYVFDELERQTQVIAPPVAVEERGNAATTLRPTVVTGFNTFGEATEQKDPRGNVTSTTYSQRGLISSQTAPSYTPPGSTTAMVPTISATYDPAGRIATRTDTVGNVTRYTYDQFGNLTTVDSAANNGTDRQQTTYTYSRNGRQLSVTDANGTRTESTYDDLDRLVTSTLIERYPTVLNLTTTSTYDTRGNVTALKNAGGATTTNQYDGSNQLTKTTDPNGVVTTYGWDGLGRQSYSSDAAGRSSKTVFDPAGRPTSTQEVGSDGTVLRAASSTYDAAGQLLKSQPSVGQPRTFTYDVLGRLKTQTEPIDSTRSVTTGFGYDAGSNRTRYTNGRGANTVYTYNSLGSPEATIEPSTTAHPNQSDRTWTTAYDAAGRATKMTAPGGVTQTATYDANSNPTSIIGVAPAAGAQPALTTTKQFSYDADGQLLTAGAPTVAGAASTDSYTYNDRGLVLTARGQGGSTSLSYTRDGQIKTRTDASGTASFVYLNNRLATITDSVTQAVIGLGYDTAGQLKTLDYGAGQVRTFGYDSAGRLNSDVLRNGASAVVASQAYTFDINNRLTNKTTTGVAGASANNYEYDEMGRLTAWTVSGGARTTYEYDANSNRTKVNGTVATYDERDRLTNDGTSAYTYTPRGTRATKVTGATTEASTFDAFGRLLTQGSQSYLYDDQDRLAKQGTSRLKYLGATTNIASDGQQTFGHDPTGDLISSNTGSNPELLITDRHDDVIGSFTPGNADLTSLADTTTYDPWGKVTAKSGTPSRAGYQSSWTSESSGLVNANARWYDTNTGGFTSRDTAQYSGGSASLANKYLYGSADPLDMTDGTGMWPKWSSVVSAAKKVGSGFVSAAKTVGNAVKTAAVWTYNTVKTGVSYAVSALKSTASFLADLAAKAYKATMASIKAIGTQVSKIISSTTSVLKSTYNWAAANAKSAAQVAYEAAVKVTETAKAVVQYAVTHNPIPAIAAAIKPIYAGISQVVSAAANLPAQIVAVTVDVVQDVQTAAQAVYQAAVDAAGTVVQAVSTAAQAVGEFAQNNWKDIVAGIAVGVGCGLITAATAGAGALACAVIGGAIAGAITSALDCPEGKSVASCAAKGAAVGAVTSLAGGALGKLGKVGLTKIAESRGVSAVAGGADDVARTASASAKGAPAPETFYRTMSKSDYDTLNATGRVPATTETMISGRASFSAKYDGEMVRFDVKSGTKSQLEQIGVRDTSRELRNMYPDMPVVFKGWGASNAFFKKEGDGINIGLGTGPALDIFNDSIESFGRVPK